MKNIFNVIRFFIGSAILFSMASFSINEMNRQSCNISNILISFDGNRFVTDELILDYLDANGMNPDSLQINDVSFKDIENLLINHSSIKDAEVYSDILGNIVMHIRQREPIVRIQDHNTGYYIDKDGLIMPFSETYTSRTLLITGDINSVDLTDLFLLSEYIYNDIFLSKQIVQIDVTDSRLLMIPRIGARIEFGKVIDIKNKFEKLRLYYDQGNQKNDKYRTINLEYNNQIVCKKK